MKQTILMLYCIVHVFSGYGQSPLRESNAVKKAAKKWLFAWDIGRNHYLKKHSTDSTLPCHVSYLIDTHAREDSMILWHKATWWLVKRDIVDGQKGYWVTPSFDPGPGPVDTSPSLPLFLQKNKKNRWVVNIYLSNFCLCEADLYCEEQLKN